MGNSRPFQPRLPFTPLEDYLARRRIPIVSLFVGITVRRWREEGVPFYTCDEIAVRLGRLPWEIWDDPVAGWDAVREQLDRAYYRRLCRDAFEEAVA